MNEEKLREKITDYTKCSICNKQMYKYDSFYYCKSRGKDIFCHKDCIVWRKNNGNKTNPL